MLLHSFSFNVLFIISVNLVYRQNVYQQNIIQIVDYFYCKHIKRKHFLEWGIKSFYLSVLV